MGLKKLVKKVTRPIGKAIKKIVPKELAGIMQVAAPLAGPYAPLVYAAGAYKQSGRINPIALATMALPYVGIAQGTGPRSLQGIGIGRLRYGKFNPATLGELGQSAGGIKTARDYLGLRAAGEDTLRGKFDDFLFGETRPGTTDVLNTTTAEQGILGQGGRFDIKAGKLLSSVDKETGKVTLSKTKIGAAVASGLSLSQTQEQIEEEGIEDGLASDEIARLQAEAAEMWQDFDTTAFKPKITAAIGGLMRKNLAMGSKGKPRPGEIFEDSGLEFPVIDSVKPNVGKMAEAVDVDILRQMFMEALKNGDIPPGTDFDTYKDMMMTLMSKTQAKKGGLMRSNYALGTMPTKEESGLGGLPIEADMRYTGGFMPYGAKEKADDVPARLSKNEFVFTADAVRAAGGGSVQKGAQKMYNTMKQLESMGRMT